MNNLMPIFVRADFYNDGQIKPICCEYNGHTAWIRAVSSIYYNHPLLKKQGMVFNCIFRDGTCYELFFINYRWYKIK